MTSEGQARSRSGIIAMIVIVLLALGAGMLTASLLFKSKTDFSALSATVFQQPRAVQPFELLDHHGESFTPESLRGQWSFVFFGYTHCPDVCPTTLSVLNSVALRLADAPDATRFVFVTVDPERDTPEVLARYVTYFNGEFVGVTGEPSASASSIERTAGSSSYSTRIASTASSAIASVSAATAATRSPT